MVKIKGQNRVNVVCERPQYLDCSCNTKKTIYLWWDWSGSKKEGREGKPKGVGKAKTVAFAIFMGVPFIGCDPCNDEHKDGNHNVGNEDWQPKLARKWIEKALDTHPTFSFRTSGFLKN